MKSSKELYDSRTKQLNEMGLVYAGQGWSAPGANKEDVFISFSQITNYDEQQWEDLMEETWGRLGIAEHATSMGAA